MRIGCCVPIEQYELAASLGFDYAELPAWEIESLDSPGLEALLKKRKETGLPISRLNAYCRGKPAIVGGECNDEATRAYAKSLMSKAAALGVETIGVGAPPARRLPEGYDAALADRQCEQFLRITAAEAAAHGITLLLESLQSGVCNYMNKLEQAQEMVRRVNLPQVDLMADLYHMETQGESWDLLRRFSPRHVHVSTVGPGLARGLYGPGDEEACFEAFQAIFSSGYSGTVSIEPDASALTETRMRAALELMRRACRQAENNRKGA